MSRWIQGFESHPFQAVWAELKDVLSEATVDDETVVTSTIELARLKKVVSYVDGIINGLDPELVPLGTWDAFNGQATPCLQHIKNYNSNRNIGHITNANAHADNLLTYVRPYMVAPNDVMSHIVMSAKAYSSTVEEYMNEFKGKADEYLAEIAGNKESSEILLEKSEVASNAISALNETLFGENNDGGIKNNIDRMKLDFDEKYNEIVNLYNETFVGESGEDSTKESIENAKEEVVASKEAINSLLEEVSVLVKELGQFHVRMFGKADENGKKVGGLSGELDNRVKALSDFEVEQKNKYQALNVEIEALLPGATSAGLATAYLDMKTSFDKPIRNAGLVFYFSIGLLVIASFILAVDTVGGEKWISFVRFDSWDTVLKGLVYKVPFYAPVLWLAFYATKRRSEYQRLQQEYAHKEALAKSYNSYKKQIEALDDEDFAMQKEFVMKAIDAIAYNASKTLDGKHGDNMPAQDVLEKLLGAIKELKESKGA